MSESVKPRRAPHPGTLAPEELARLRADGFLVVRDYFADGELQPVRDEIAGVVDEVARRLQRAGKLAETYPHLGFDQRLTALEREYPTASVLVHFNGLLGPALARLWSTPRLLDLVQQLIGPEIAGHPVWNRRAKTPLNPLATVPWHQDTAYMLSGCEGTYQPTAWIPLVDADAENGTLQVIRGGHRHGVRRHRLENGIGDPRSWYLYIADEDLPPGEPVTCTMPAGSLLLFDQLLPHRSTENRSAGIRWSVDLRWQRPDQPSGYEAIKPPILLRTARDPAYRPDWATWARHDRVAPSRAGDEFAIDVDGGWMRRWEGGGAPS